MSDTATQRASSRGWNSSSPSSPGLRRRASGERGLTGHRRDVDKNGKSGHARVLGLFLAISGSPKNLLYLFPRVLLWLAMQYERVHQVLIRKKSIPLNRPRVALTSGHTPRGS